MRAYTSFVALAVAAIAAPAAASEELGASLRFDADAARLALASQPGDAPASTPSASETPVFLQPGPWWGTVQFGYAREVNVSDPANDFHLSFAFSTFLVEDFEFMIRLGLWAFDQPGKDAIGLGFELGFRWHFFEHGDLTVFADGGAGLFGSSHNVPEGGTSFNFTPFAGAGMTHAIGSSGTRLVLGVRWHHISNARINGEDRNPSRDGVMVYAGVQFPF